MGSGVMKRMEWSKRILIFSYSVLMGLLVVFLACEDKVSTATVVCAWIVECGAATGFYFWKAKNENRSKYALRFIEKLADKYGIDSVGRILDTVLKD